MARFSRWLQGVHEGDTVAQVARCALEVRLQAVHHFLEDALHAADESDSVHQLRVWTRRADAALRLFRAALPEKRAKQLQKTLRKIRRRAGAVRDCDVHQERLQARTDALPKQVLPAFQEQRQQARRKLQALRRRLLKHDRLASQCDRLLARIEWPKRHSSRAAPPFAPWCRQELALLAARLFALADGDLRSDDAWHALRIAGKRLRYALELSAAALRPVPCQRLYEDLSELQDRLGAVGDRGMAVRQLRVWAKQARGTKARRQLRTLLEQAQQEHAAERHRLSRWWTPARRQRLRRRWNAAV